MEEPKDPHPQVGGCRGSAVTAGLVKRVLRLCARKQQSCEVLSDGGAFSKYLCNLAFAYLI